MASKGGGCPASVWNMVRCGLKPLTQHNLKTHYAPITGVTSYMALAVNVSSPDLFLRLFRNHDITNNLLIGAVVGNAAYLYNRKHMTQVSSNIKILYSGFGAVFFSVGSVLLWAILSNLLPDNSVTRSTAGLISGAFFLQVAKNYLDLIDGTSQVQSKP